MAEAVRTAPGYATGDFPAALKAAFAAVDAALCSQSGREDMMQRAMDTQDSGSVAAAAARAQVRKVVASIPMLAHITLAQAKAGLLRYAAARGADVAQVAAAWEKRDTPGGPHCGCTALVALVVQPTTDNPCTTIYVANCGDSRAVLCDARGTAVALSVDHTPQLASEASRIEAAGCFVADGRVGGTLALSRALGDAAFKSAAHLDADHQAVIATPDVVTWRVSGGDHFMLLACDGLWDCHSNQGAVDFVRGLLEQGVEPKEAAARLCATCVATDPQQMGGLGLDNVTILVVMLNKQGGAAAAAGLGGACHSGDAARASLDVRASRRQQQADAEPGPVRGARVRRHGDGRRMRGVAKPMVAPHTKHSLKVLSA